LGIQTGAARPHPVTASLLGSGSQIIGGINVVAEGGAAIALSQGGAPKRYPHTDPNEDAAGFALGEAGILLTVADGHTGREAAEIAVPEVLRGAEPCLAQRAGESFRDQWPTSARELVAAIQQAILVGVTHGARDSARTTLAIAVVRPAEGLLAYASIGDSHIFSVGESEVVDLAFHPERQKWWLGNPAQEFDAMASNVVIGVEELRDTRAIVLATDGISEPGIGVDHPEFTVAECTTRTESAQLDLRPLELARHVTDAVLAAHRRHRSGDNIAAAVSWLSHSGPSNP
jgi:serine/threonine protein phosphatase PrpC